MKFIINLINSALEIFGVKIVRISDTSFSMISAIQRIVEHDIPIENVIDIGASNGKWSINTMKIFPRACHLAIEPLHEHEMALENIKQKRNNFDYVLCVVGDVDGSQATINVSDDLDGSTIDGIGGEPREVIVRTIDAIIYEKKLGGPFLLKFDTHGYEIPILNGAINTLEKTNIIIMEVYNFKITDRAERFHKMCSHMEKLGFRCYDIADPMLRICDKAFWQMDIFFCRSDSKIFSYSQYK